MKKISKKQGIALAEYVFIAALFAFTIGIAIFQMSPGILRKYFEKSMGANTTTTSTGTLTMKVMGE